MWSALKSKRIEKIKHLTKKYPKISNHQRRISKNKVNTGATNTDDTTKRTTIESLTDMEKLKNAILNTYQKDICEELVIIKDNTTVNLQFSYEDVGNISQINCLEQIKFVSAQITGILETCKHEHNLPALHQLQQSCIRMVGKMRKYCDKNILSDKQQIIKKRLLKKTILQMSQLDNIILAVESLFYKRK